MRQDGKNGSSFWKILLIVSLLGVAAGLVFLILHLYGELAAQKDYEEAKETVAAVSVPEGPEEEPVTQEEIESLEFTGEREGEAAKLPDGIFLDAGDLVDFEMLSQINSDLYAWVRVPGTKIDYPVAQRSGDDSFYLNHDMYREWRFAGCIYSEDINKKDFSDPLTVLYGHNMANGSMFQNLHLFADEKFFDEHPFIYIYTSDEVIAYEIFAAYVYDNRHILRSLDNVDEEQKEEAYEEYLSEILSGNLPGERLREDLEVTSGDHILTLATCVGNAPEQRYLVQGVKVWSGTPGEYIEKKDELS